MEYERKALGKGLSALISEATLSFINESSKQNKNSVMNLSIDNIQPNLNQPRKNIEESELNELAQSISLHGILQPILVQVINEQGKYQIIAGERRWRAAKKIGLKQIPCLIKNINDNDAFEIAIIENIQREDLTPLEEAEAYNKLIEVLKYTQEDLAEKLGKSRSHITNTIRLLKLPKDVKLLVEQHQLSAGHARALVNSSDPLKMAKNVLDNKLNVRQTEALIKQKNKDTNNNIESKYKKDIKENNKLDPDIAALEQKISANLGITVKIKMEKKTSEIVLHFADLDQFDMLVGVLCNPL